MALLTHYRLGWPSSTGFRMWTRTNDSVATVTLETRLPGTTTWTTQDENPVDLSKGNTRVLNATNLQPATKYEYRILVDSVESVTNSTYTMPSQGRFIVYHHSDSHNNSWAPRAWIDASSKILQDWETNYEPFGIPAFLVCTGDWYINNSSETQTTTFNNMLQVVSDGQALHARLPQIYCVGDWDFAGNNSSKDFINTNATYSEHVDVLQWMWRDMDQPAAPTLATSLEVAGVPFILLDERTLRESQTGLTPSLTGAESLGSGTTALGSDQREWVEELLVSYRSRKLVVLCNHTLMRTQIAQQGIPGIASARDSIGIFYKAELQSLVNTAIASGYANNLVFWCGDDHRNTVWKGYVSDTRTSNLDYPVPFDTLLQRALPLPHLLFTVITSRSAVVGNSEGKFGLAGDLFEWSGNQHDCAVRWDITSLEGGVSVSARVTYIHLTGNQDPPGVLGTAPEGDFYYENGYFNQYDVTSTEVTQVHPCENSPHRGVHFTRSFVEDLASRISTLVMRNRDGRLDSYEDPRDWDKPGRDEYKETLDRDYYDIPPEDPSVR